MINKFDGRPTVQLCPHCNRYVRRSKLELDKFICDNCYIVIPEEKCKLGLKKDLYAGKFGSNSNNKKVKGVTIRSLLHMRVSKGKEYGNKRPCGR